MRRDHALEACAEISDALLLSDASINDKAAFLSMCSAHFLGSAAAVFNQIAKRKGENFSQEEMVRSTANIIVDLTFGKKQ